jgi:serine/threonine-protein kinase SBK
MQNPYIPVSLVNSSLSIKSLTKRYMKLLKMNNSLSISSSSNSKESSPSSRELTSSSTNSNSNSSSSSSLLGGTSYSSSGPNGSSSLREMRMEEEFSIIKVLAEGTYSKVYLAKRFNSSSSERLVLKAVHSELTSSEEFQRELHLTYFLSPHPNILTCFNVSFMWDNSFVFVQEHAPFGPLSRFINKSKGASGGGLPEAQVKLMANQVVSALEFMHQVHLVHRDVTPDNVLVFKSNLSLVKLCDFGCTRQQGSLVVRADSSQNLSFAPPEICELLPQERYHCYTSSDVWQVGILILHCLTGGAQPVLWNSADIITDAGFRHYESWLRRKSLKIPEALKPFSPRFVRLLKRLLEPKPCQRSEVREVFKYMKDDWFRRKRAVTIGCHQFALERQDGIKLKGSNNGNGAKRHNSHDDSTTVTNSSASVTATPPMTIIHRLSIKSKGNNSRLRSNSVQSSHQQNRNCNYSKDEVNCCEEMSQLKELGIQTEVDKGRVEEWILSTTATTAAHNNTTSEKVDCH